MPIESKMFEGEMAGSRMLIIAIKQTGITAWQRGWSTDRPAFTFIEATKHEPQYGLPYVMWDTQGTIHKHDHYPHIHRSWSWEFAVMCKLIAAKFDTLKTSEEAIINLDATFPQFADLHEVRKLSDYGYKIPCPDEVIYKKPLVPR